MTRQVLAIVWALSAPAPDAAIAYRVTAGPEAAQLSVEVAFPSGTPTPLAVDQGAEPFVADVALAEGGSWRPLLRRGRTWMLPSCPHGCRVRYRFALADAARALDDVDLAALRARTLIAPTSTWLLRPSEPRPHTSFQLSVTSPPGWQFVSGLRQLDDGNYRSFLPDGFEAPYAAFGPFHLERLTWSTGRLDVAVSPGRDAAPALRWLKAAGDAMVAYYGRFPVRRLLTVVLPARAHLMGKTMGVGGATILLAPVDDPASAPDDWVATHELVHVATPDLPRRHRWLTEGLATYVEPIARARAGQLAVDRIWADMLEGMPKGLRHETDRGLDDTGDWGRIYWGGALFCLLADVEIRERTGNRLGLEDALRAVLNAGGTIEEAWTLDRFLAEADRPLPHPVLRPLYERMGRAPMAIDLPALWKKLGVVPLPRGGVTFDNDAPLAAIRRAITARRMSAP